MAALAIPLPGVGAGRVHGDRRSGQLACALFWPCSLASTRLARSRLAQRRIASSRSAGPLSRGALPFLRRLDVVLALVRAGVVVGEELPAHGVVDLAGGGEADAGLEGAHGSVSLLVQGSVRLAAVESQVAQPSLHTAQLAARVQVAGVEPPDLGRRLVRPDREPAARGVYRHCLLDDAVFGEDTAGGGAFDRQLVLLSRIGRARGVLDRQADPGLGPRDLEGV